MDKAKWQQMFAAGAAKPKDDHVPSEMDVFRSMSFSERPIQEVIEGLDVVCTLLGNIVSNPVESKFRRIRRSNSRIAKILGREEEGLLRAAGFSNDAAGEALECWGEEPGSECRAQLAKVQFVLKLAEIVKAIMREKGEMPSALAAAPAVFGRGQRENGRGLLCHEAGIGQAIECALMDYVAVCSAQSAEDEKKLRRQREREAIESTSGWREALVLKDGDFLLDRGRIEAWLDSSATHRIAASDLLDLQAASVRWYGQAAQHRSDAWRKEFANSTILVAEGVSAELQALREAMFEYPERPGAAPAIFRDTAPKQPAPNEVAAQQADGDDVAIVPSVERNGSVVVMAVE